MGLGILGNSCSSYDYDTNNKQVTKIVNITKNINCNPDPQKWTIKKSLQIENFLIIYVNYPNCTNYEGNKILVYVNLCISDLYAIGKIDPHFSDKKPQFSPIARFVPNEEGWAMAIIFCESFANKQIK